MGGWFYKKWIAFDDSLSLLREHYCARFAQPPADPVSGCNVELVPYWIGLKYLGSRGLAEDTTTRRLSFSAWSWTPGSTFRDEDFERYALMSTGVIQPIAGDSLHAGHRRPGRGLLGRAVPAGLPRQHRHRGLRLRGRLGGASGTTSADIQLNSKFAQFAYDHDYTLPIPPPSPRFAVVARDNALDFYWDDESENAFDVTSPNPRDFEGYRLYVGEDQDTLALVAQFDAAGDTAGFNTGFGAVALPEPVVVDGMHRPLQVHGRRAAERLQVLLRRDRLRPRQQHDHVARERPVAEPAHRRAGAAAGRAARPQADRLPEPLPGRGPLGPGDERARPLPVVRQPARALHAAHLHAGRATCCSRRSSTAPPTRARATRGIYDPALVARRADALRARCSAGT